LCAIFGARRCNIQKHNIDFTTQTRKGGSKQQPTRAQLARSAPFETTLGAQAFAMLEKNLIYRGAGAACHLDKAKQSLFLNANP
jgi:hypothetical protein